MPCRPNRGGLFPSHLWGLLDFTDRQTLDWVCDEQEHTCMVPSKVERSRPVTQSFPPAPLPLMPRRGRP